METREDKIRSPKTRFWAGSQLREGKVLTPYNLPEGNTFN